MVTSVGIPVYFIHCNSMCMNSTKYCDMFIQCEYSTNEKKPKDYVHLCFKILCSLEEIKVIIIYAIS